ncbi:MAG: HD domain-containing protein [Parcubacteria group bacterium]|nr:HD domain-containing protein [Parcubacteria group bacterium]
MPDIFKHILNRSLAHVTRFNSRPQHFQESVAEHSFFTTYIAGILCDLLEKENITVNREKALSMALIHDSEEVFSGDILSPFKHHSPDVKNAIKKVNQELIKEVFKDLPEDIGGKYIALWNEEGQQESIEAQVVKVSDRISLIGKCAEEVRAGNDFFKKMHDRELEALENDDKEWWQRIKHHVLNSGTRR